LVNILWAAVVEAYEAHLYIGDSLEEMQHDESLRGYQKREAGKRLKDFHSVLNDDSPDQFKLRESLNKLGKELKMHYRRKV
jgi:hypothetical protein